jgi:hypothetical protein
MSHVTGGNDAILGEVGRATAVSLVGTYHRPGMRWDTALEHLLVVPPGNNSLGGLDQYDLPGLAAEFL